MSKCIDTALTTRRYWQRNMIIYYNSITPRQADIMILRLRRSYPRVFLFLSQWLKFDIPLLIRICMHDIARYVIIENLFYWLNQEEKLIACLNDIDWVWEKHSKTQTETRFVIDLREFVFMRHHRLILRAFPDAKIGA